MTSRLSARVAAIARAFAIGSLDTPSLVQRAASATGESARTLRPLAERVAHRFHGQTRPRVRDIVALLTDDWSWLKLHLTITDAAGRRLTRTSLTSAAVMVPVAAASRWSVPSITTTAALAEWLGFSDGELAWFSNRAALGHEQWTSARHHYHYLLQAKRHGGIRVLEAPQARLKGTQRRILTEILNQIPPWYTAAHGFVKGRSVRSFAAEHVGQAVVLRVDLVDFFPSVSRARVQALFRTIGYPEPVADALGGLCTNTTPASVFTPRRWPSLHADDLRNARHLHERPHLPQGAPTSPALANLCAWRLDCRLTGLADWAGAVYSRYADDLAFSGGSDVAKRIDEYAAHIGAIASDEGWRVQHRKTRIMRQSVQQRLTGLLVNTRVNCSRREVDALRATLTNCVRHSAALQNREGRPDFRAHLLGRIGWVRFVNPAKAERLQKIFDRVDWLA